MSEPMVVQPIIQVGTSDCAVAALAMYLNVPYRLASEAARLENKTVHQKGLYTTEIKRAAARMKVALVFIRRPAEDASGILLIDKAGASHAAVLFQGVLIDPTDGHVWDLDTWLTTRGYKVRGLLCRK